MTGGGRDDRPLGRVYAAVVALEILVLAALWWLGHYFGY